MSTPPPLLRSRVSSFVATSIATAASFSAVSTILSAVSEGIQAAATAEGQGVTPGLELALRDEMNVEPENYEDCPAATQMHLSTTCDSCGERVTLEVPLWLTEGLSGANSRGQSEGEARSEWRSGVVSTAVAVAVAIKESPVSLAQTIRPPEFPLIVSSRSTFSDPESTRRDDEVVVPLRIVLGCEVLAASASGDSARGVVGDFDGGREGGIAVQEYWRDLFCPLVSPHSLSPRNETDETSCEKGGIDQVDAGVRQDRLDDYALRRGTRNDKLHQTNFFDESSFLPSLPPSPSSSRPIHLPQIDDRSFEIPLQHRS